MFGAHARRCRRLSEKAFESTKHLLPDKAAEEIRAFIYEHNEWGLGVEVLIDVLIEGDTALSQDQKEAIEQAMNEMGLDRNQSLLRVSG